MAEQLTKDAFLKKVFDYENTIDLGTVEGPVGKISADFKEHLLIECIPVKE